MSRKHVLDAKGRESRLARSPELDDWLCRLHRCAYHYEILVNGRFVDPKRVHLPRGGLLEGQMIALREGLRPDQYAG